MNIYTFLKQVPDVQDVKIDQEKGTLIRDGVPSILNPFDCTALELALRIKEKIPSAKITVFSMGPRQAKQVLQKGLAMGADEAVLLCDAAFAGADTLATAKTLAEAAKVHGPADLYLFGKHAIDGDTAQVGPEVAEMLSLPLVSCVTKLEVEGSKYALVNRIRDGVNETIEVKLPCVLTIEKDAALPRHARLSKIIESKHKNISITDTNTLKIPKENLGLKGSPTRVAKIFAPSTKRPCRILQGSIQEKAVKLKDWIQKEIANVDEHAGDEFSYHSTQVQNKTNGIMVLCQTTGGDIHKASLELIGVASRLSHRANVESIAAVIGSKDAALTASKSGVNRVLWIENKNLGEYNWKNYVSTFEYMIKAANPSVVLVSATATGREIAPGLAARLKTGLTADCTELDFDVQKGKLLQTRPAFGGNVMATIICPNHLPQISTARPGVFKATSLGKVCPEIIEKINFNFDSDSLTRLIKAAPVSLSNVNLDAVSIVVSGGKGTGGEKGFKLLSQLAGKLGGSVGATRRAIEAGWLPYDHQVGQTGKTIHPKLYIACGISGAIQHVVGIIGANKIVAINKDPKAQIFNNADIGIIENLHEFLPRLIETL